MTQLPLRHRLYVSAGLEQGASVSLTAAQAHYLNHVVRLQPNDTIALFNGQDGEWQSRLVRIRKSGAEAQAITQLREQVHEPDLCLLFAPIKGHRIDTIVEKATELGVRNIWPVITQRTVVSRVNIERLQANAVEAAEQSERLSVPKVFAPLSLDRALSEIEPNRYLIFCDERSLAPSISQVLATLKRGQPCALLTGPEGGFTAEEQRLIERRSNASSVTLGPRILRADTAVIAALTIWQSILGDWH